MLVSVLNSLSNFLAKNDFGQDHSVLGRLCRLSHKKIKNYVSAFSSCHWIIDCSFE